MTAIDGRTPTELLAAEELPEEGLDELAGRLEAGEELAVRDALAKAAKAKADADRLRQIKAAILDRYDERIRHLDALDRGLRDAVRGWLEAHGRRNIAFPDVGTAYLTTRSAALKIADVEALAAWTSARGVLIPTYEVYDEKAALELAAGELHLAATSDGHVFDQATGECLDVPGLEAKPATTSLGVRR
jgi:hypothetical protein